VIRCFVLVAACRYRSSKARCAAMIQALTFSWKSSSGRIFHQIGSGPVGANADTHTQAQPQLTAQRGPVLAGVSVRRFTKWRQIFLFARTRGAASLLAACPTVTGTPEPLFVTAARAAPTDFSLGRKARCSHRPPGSGNLLPAGR
jgi:hypothetical protein